MTKKDFYFVGAVMLFMALVYVWQVYRETGSELPVFQSTAVKTDNSCQTTPKFDDYKIETLALKGATFAGRYRISTTTCGQFCESYSLADIEDKETKELDIKSEIGANFASTSRLLILNPPSDMAKALSYYPIMTSFYEMRDGELKLICERPVN